MRLLAIAIVVAAVLLSGTLIWINRDSNSSKLEQCQSLLDAFDLRQYEFPEGNGAYEMNWAQELKCEDVLGKAFPD